MIKFTGKATRRPDGAIFLMGLQLPSTSFHSERCKLFYSVITLAHLGLDKYT